MDLSFLSFSQTFLITDKIRIFEGSLVVEGRFGVNRLNIAQWVHLIDRAGDELGRAGCFAQLVAGQCLEKCLLAGLGQADNTYFHDNLGCW
ncbi:MAG: hypothetical protein RBT36_01430 [Desulfobulbus sp.]|jgi:hypothetical protein|nr:hypothetical protein [Desulfobulbus sp.]